MILSAKKYVAALLVFVCVCMIFSPLTAYAAEDSSQHETVKVGFFAMDGYHVMDEEGNRSGYGYDFLRLMARYWDVDYEYVGYDQSWDDMQQMLEDGEIDMVTSPSGHPVAMVHCQNCTSDLNAWVNLFREFAQTFGMEISTNDLFGKLYNKALEGDADCGGLLAYNYFSGEHVTGFNEGRPVFARTPDAKFNLATFKRVNLFTSLGALKVGLDILMKEEHVQVDQILGHGGLFKTKGVGQKILAGAIDAPVSVMETAGEGGAWGIALLASYMINKEENETLEDYLDAKVFAGNAGTKMDPDPADVAGFEVFTERYKKGLPIERAAVESLK